MEYNKYVDLEKIEDEIFEKTMTEALEIGWFKEFYEDFQKIINIREFGLTSSVFLVLLPLG